MKIIKKVCNRKINKIFEKIIKIWIMTITRYLAYVLNLSIFCQ